MNKRKTNSAVGDIRLADRTLIHEILYRWAQAIDRLDFDAMRSIFHPDAYDDHLFYCGGIEGLIKALRERHKHIVFSMHQVSNVIIHFEGMALAQVESYAVVNQHTANLLDSDLASSTSWCRYIDKVEMRDGEWRILNRKLVIDAIVGGRVPSNTQLGVPEPNRGRRDNRDPSY